MVSAVNLFSFCLVALDKQKYKKKNKKPNRFFPLFFNKEDAMLHRFYSF